MCDNRGGGGASGMPLSAPPPSVQGMVAHQDSLLELQLQDTGERRERLSRTNSRKEAPAPPAPSPADRQASDLSLLQKQHSLLQEELSRCRQLCQEKAQEAAVLEARLRESEQERAQQEQLVEEARRQLAALRQPGEAWVRKGVEPRRRSLPAGDALYQSFTPPLVRHSGTTPSPHQEVAVPHVAFPHVARSSTDRWHGP